MRTCIDGGITAAGHKDMYGLLSRTHGSSVKGCADMFLCIAVFLQLMNLRVTHLIAQSC